MKKFVDKNGRLFGKISLLDVAVILLVVVVALVLFAKKNFTPIRNQSDGMVNIQYEVVVENMPEGRLTSLREGDLLYDSDSNIEVGEIVSIDAQPCVIAILMADGTYKTAPVEGRYNVYLTVEAEAAKNEHDHYYVDRSLLIGSGWLLNFFTKASLFTGTITDLAEIPA